MEGRIRVSAVSKHFFSSSPRRKSSNLGSSSVMIMVAVGVRDVSLLRQRVGVVGRSCASWGFWRSSYSR